MPMEIVIMVLALGLGGMFTGIVTDYLKTKRQVAKTEASSGLNDEVMARIDAMSQRLAALEAIVTDEDRELTRKFDQLREDAKRGVA